VSPSLALSRVYTALDVPSRRLRPPPVAARLRQVASRIKCYCLQGEVAFDGAEFVVRSLMQATSESDSFILDMHRVSYLADSAAWLLHDVRQLLVAQGKAVVFSRIRGRAVVEAALRHALPEGDNGYLSFEDNDLALEWCEERLLSAETELPPPEGTVAGFPLFAGMSERALTLLRERLRSVDFVAGAIIISSGEEQDDRVFFLREGEVSVVLSLGDGSHQRLATLSAGMSFGEMVMLGSRARSASVHADTAVRSWTLSAEALDELAVNHPEIKIAILKNLSLDLAHKLRQANQLIGVLAA
jgi:glutaminase